MLTVESGMSLCPVLETFEFVSESRTRDENESCRCHGLNLCHSWEVFPWSVTFILSIEGLRL